jgi:tetratricopeptide (TPR) repeat protein
MEVNQGQEKVILNQRAVPWPKGLAGRVDEQDEENLEPEPWQTEDYPLSLVQATLTLNWTLTEPASGAVIDAGTCTDHLQRSFGGFLGALGRASQSIPTQENVLALMAPGLAEQLIEALGPAYSASALATASDSLSHQAAPLAGNGEWDQAAQIWQKLLQQNPDYTPALYNLGLYHERLGDLDTAWAFYRLAYINTNTWPYRIALTRLADSLERLGRPPRAAPPRPF